MSDPKTAHDENRPPPPSTDWLHDGPEDGPRVLLSHGAGAPMDHPFLEDVARGLAAAGCRVSRFEFPYMVKRRHDGKRRPPDRMPRLETALREAVDAVGGPRGLVLVGKSMGGRVAVRVADRLGVAGVGVLGFPFHPSGKPDKTRLEHLSGITTPTLICQGERDPMGRRHEVRHYLLSEAVRLLWLPDGDHSLKPRKRSGHTHAEHVAAAVEHVAAFVHRVSGDV